MQRSKLIFYSLLLVGGGLLLWGLWIPAKAELAQYLLKRSWQQSLLTGKRVPPWPWADMAPVGELRVPHLGLSYIILEGASGEALAFGPAHLRSSAGLGESGNAVIAGHRDTSFQFLGQLKKGDLLELQSLTQPMRYYRVQGMEVAEVPNIYLTDPVDSWLTLITCYPFDALVPGGPGRYLVFAQETTGP